MDQKKSLLLKVGDSDFAKAVLESPQPVLVDASSGGDSFFEGGECGSQKSGQLQKPLGSAIGVGTRFESGCRESLERRHRSIPAAQLIVERQDFQDESRSQ